MRERVRVAAIADVHSPRYLHEFEEALSRCKEPDLFLLAGDMINFGKLEEYRNIASAITNQFGNRLPIVACFGNDEMGATQQSVYDIVGERIKFLDGDFLVIHHNDRKVGILGVSILNAIKNPEDKSLEDIFEEKIRHLARQLGELKRLSDKSILLLHYSPLSTETFPEAFSWWISKTFQEAQPDLIVHGHVHYAIKPEVRIGPTQIINVAYPATHKVTEFQI
ncbi:MAG: metallophosphoesterase family protein [Candidatus Thorarchaeota archaeon]|jgi:Icc-related predicted phosphoesterase